MAVEVVDNCCRKDVADDCERAGCRLLELLDLGSSDVAVLLCDDEHIENLNRHYRGQDRATDVLSFSQEEGEQLAAPDEHRILGDIVISLQTASEQAERGGWSLSEETNRLFLHGLLHLLGYDHENGGEQERKMRHRELELAMALNKESIPCAYADLDQRGVEEGGHDL